jgi:hypothetical protein
MSVRQQLTVRLSGMGMGTASLDGHSIENTVSGIDLHAQVGEPVTATLHLAGGLPVDIETEAEVHLPEETQALLKRLGWAPPEEATP